MALNKIMTKNLSPQAVKQAVLTETIQKPLTIYSVCVGLLGGTYSLLVAPTTIALSVFIAGLVIGSGNWCWEYLIKRDYHSNLYVKRYKDSLAMRRQEMLASLVSDLNSINDESALKQVSLFSAKYDTFVEILDKKLTVGGLTYNRYLSIAEQVFLGGLDNLENVAIALKSISAIDVNHIERSSKKLKKELTDNSDMLIKTIEQRLEIREEQLKHVGDLLFENEKALTQLDLVTTKIASINTQQGRSRVDLEDAMNELQHLIQRADSYSK